MRVGLSDGWIVGQLFNGREPRLDGLGYRRCVEGIAAAARVGELGSIGAQALGLDGRESAFDGKPQAIGWRRHGGLRGVGATNVEVAKAHIYLDNFLGSPGAKDAGEGAPKRV